jgi:hypothetical protein
MEWRKSDELVVARDAGVAAARAALQNTTKAKKF